MLKFVIIFALFLQYFWEQFLVYLNVRFIEQRERQFPDILPEVLKNRFTAYDCRKALLYSKAKASFGRITGAFSTLIIAFVIGFSMPGLLDQLVGNFPFRRVSFCIIVLFIVQFLAIPFQVYADFVIEQRFGFNKMTLRTFVIDHLKGWCISLVLLAPLLWLIFYVYDVAGNYWWFLAFLLFSGFQFTMLILYPLIIAPLFNRFTSLEEGELLTGIRRLTSSVRFPVRGVFVMDGSKRSSHTNAYFTGVGKARRIVFFDTLKEKLSEKELLSVIAHELGHFKLHHVRISLLIAVIGSFVGFFLFNLLLRSKTFFASMGYGEPSVHVGLVLLVLIMPVLDMFLGPLFNALSRKHEYDADKFSIEATSDPGTLSEALVKLNKDNLSFPLTHPLYSFINYSHPPLAERLQRIETLS